VPDKNPLQLSSKVPSSENLAQPGVILERGGYITSESTSSIMFWLYFCCPQNLCHSIKLLKYTVKYTSSIILQYVPMLTVTLYKTCNINCSFFVNCNDVMEERNLKVVQKETSVIIYAQVAK